MSSFARVALVAVFLSAFLPVNARLSTGLDRFSEETGCPPPIEGNAVQILDDAALFYDELLKDIHEAKEHILMEFFIFRDDSISTVFLDALAAKVQEGVRTCLVVDYYGCAQHLEEKGNRLRTQPFRHGYLQPYLDSGVDIVLYNPGGIFPRNHRKLALIDGKVAYTGGMNISDLYLDGIAGVGKFWDMHLKVTGPAVSYFYTGFTRIWNTCGDRPLAVANPRQSVSCGDVPLIVLETQGTGIHPNPDEIYTRLFASAQDTIRFISGYFCPGKVIRNALKEAARRGVTVQILMGASTDMPPLIDKVLMRSATSLSKEENFTLFIQPGGFHHEKVVSIDGHLIVIGSHNLDWFSVKTNHELSVLMDSPAIATEFDRYFDRHAQSGSL